MKILLLNDDFLPEARGGSAVIVYRLAKKFKELKKAKKKAFIAFITAGYPNLSITEKLIYEFDKIGVDI